MKDRLLPLKQTIHHPLDPRSLVRLRTPTRRRLCQQDGSEAAYLIDHLIHAADKAAGTRRLRLIVPPEAVGYQHESLRDAYPDTQAQDRADDSNPK